MEDLIKIVEQRIADNASEFEGNEYFGGEMVENEVDYAIGYQQAMREVLAILETLNITSGGK